MASLEEPLSCPRCPKHFTQKSSLVRHLKRCTGDMTALSRQKACRQCSSTKVRCDLRRPTCGRCQARSLPCQFVPRDRLSVPLPAAIPLPLPVNSDEELPSFQDEGGDGSTFSFVSLDEGRPTPATTDSLVSGPGIDSRGTHDYVPEGIPPKLVLSKERRQIILGTAPNSPNSDAVVRHTMYFVIRVLKSWPRVMAAHHTAQLPPPIHRLQIVDGIPKPLANCYALTKMWAEHTDGSRELMENTIIHEIQRLLTEYTTYDENILLAAAQSLLIMVIMLFFSNSPPALPHPADAQLLVQIWDVKHHLSKTGLLLDQEVMHTVPPWRQWAMVAAKRRTIHSFHHVEWAWSLLHGYPVITCFELGPLPAPPARYLWQEADETRWRHLYADWLGQWKDGFYRMMEIFHINPGGALDFRSELWLAEADEYGMMVMAEGKLPWLAFLPLYID